MRRLLPVCGAMFAFSLTLACHGLATAAPRLPGMEADRSLDLPIEGEVTRPDWAQLPSGDDLSHFYPPLAMFFSITGTASINCSVTAQGALEDCAVATETPVGLGFGSASLQLGSLFRMKPLSVDGAPVAGARVTVPIRFALDDVDASQVPAPAVLSARTAAELELGRRLVVALHLADQRKADATQYVDQFRKQLAVASNYDPAVRGSVTTLMDAFNQALQASIQQQIDETAALYARSLTDEEMTQIVRFMESPAGKAWVNNQPAINLATRQIVASHFQAVKDETRRRFCEQVACAKPRATASR